MIFLIILGALIDIFGLVSLLPVLSVAIDETQIQKNKLISFIYEYFNFQSTESFLLTLITILLFIFIIKNVFHMGIAHAKYRFQEGKSISNLK